MAAGNTEIEHRVAVAKRLAANIRAYLGELTPEQWEQQSACAEWQVRDVVSHLIGGAERQTDSMERGRSGDANPPAGFATSWSPSPPATRSSTGSSTNTPKDHGTPSPGTSDAGP